jgi:hypothetical protein
MEARGQGVRRPSVLEQGPPALDALDGDKAESAANTSFMGIPPANPTPEPTTTPALTYPWHALR